MSLDEKMWEKIDVIRRWFEAANLLCDLSVVN